MCARCLGHLAYRIGHGHGRGLRPSVGGLGFAGTRLRPDLVQRPDDVWRARFGSSLRTHITDVLLLPTIRTRSVVRY